MKRSLLLPTFLACLLIPASGASAKSYTLGFLQEDSQSQTTDYKASVESPKGWKFSRYDDKPRTGITLYKKVSKKCDLVMNLYTYSSSDYDSETPNPNFFYDLTLRLSEDNQPVATGSLTNKKTSAGSLNLFPTGGWAYIQGESTSGTPAYKGAGGYSSAEKVDEEYYPVVGVVAEIGGNLFSSCNAKEINKNKSVIPAVVKSVQIK